MPAAALLATVLLVGLLAACTNQPANSPNPNSAAAVISSLGAVPIPTAPVGAPAPVTASIGHPQLLAIGAPVWVSLPGGTQALITTSGPTEDLPSGQTKPNSPVRGTITVTAVPSTGSVRLSSVDIACRDQTGAPVALTPVGPAAVSATPGHPAGLRLTGTFRNGDAQINWRQDGHVVAVWDFTIETD